MKYPTWLEELEKLVGDETVIAVRFGDELDNIDEVAIPPELAVAGQTMPWDRAREVLVAACELVDPYWLWPMLTWTETRVIFTHDYDTMRSFRTLPRNPEGDWDGEVVQ